MRNMACICQFMDRNRMFPVLPDHNDRFVDDRIERSFLKVRFYQYIVAQSSMKKI